MLKPLIGGAVYLINRSLDLGTHARLPRRNTALLATRAKAIPDDVAGDGFKNAPRRLFASPTPPAMAPVVRAVRVYRMVLTVAPNPRERRAASFAKAHAVRQSGLRRNSSVQDSRDNQPSA
jgi:hypothetical protein